MMKAPAVARPVVAVKLAAVVTLAAGKPEVKVLQVMHLSLLTKFTTTTAVRIRVKRLKLLAWLGLI